jgi:predicted regulator of Ras-like GTPase activity (Roadblock/LC7/MglB family)
VGYSLPGFVATAVVSMDGQPIAQVAVDGLDVSGVCTGLASLLRGALQSLNKEQWGQHEDTIITSATHHILLRIPGSEAEVFQVLVTTRESDPVESLDVLASVEGAIVSAL